MQRELVAIVTFSNGKSVTNTEIVGGELKGVHEIFAQCLGHLISRIIPAEPIMKKYEKIANNQFDFMDLVNKEMENVFMKIVENGVITFEFRNCEGCEHHIVKAIERNFDLVWK